MSDSAPRYRLFPNGTAFMVWTERNCDGCTKRMPHDGAGENPKCNIETAIALGAVTDGTLRLDGRRSADECAKLAERLKWDGKGYLESDCPEKVVFGISHREEEKELIQRAEWLLEQSIVSAAHRELAEQVITGGSDGIVRNRLRIVIEAREREEALRPK